MNSPGIQSLGDFTIGAAGMVVGDWVTGLEGAIAIRSQMRLAYGSGGTKIQVYLQTSLDQGTTAIDIECFTFLTAGAVKVRCLTLISRTSDLSPTDGSLADDTSLDGVLGDRFRIKVVSTGAYAGQTVLSARICAS
jgi:hypothetical protein